MRIMYAEFITTFEQFFHILVIRIWFGWISMCNRGLAYIVFANTSFEGYLILYHPPDKEVPLYLERR